jgi:hypothetical protein
MAASFHKSQNLSLTTILLNSSRHYRPLTVDV